MGILEVRIILNDMRGKIRMIPNKFDVLIKFEFGTINNCELVFSFLVEIQISGKKGEIRKRKTNKYISWNV